MAMVRPPETVAGRFSHAVMLVVMSQAYARVDQRERAAEVLEGADVSDSPGGDSPELREALPQLRFGIALSKVLNLLVSNRIGALEAIESLGAREYASVSPGQWPMVLDLLGTIVTREGFSRTTARTLRVVIGQIDMSDDACRTSALRIAAAAGFGVSRGKGERESLEECFPESVLGGLLRLVARGVLSGELDDGRSAREDLAGAVAIAREQGWTGGLFWSDLQGHFGDAARMAGDDAAAVTAYEECRAASTASTFMWAWSSWRLGLFREDVDALNDAATAFRMLELNGMWARALGARGAVFLKAGQDVLGIQCMATIVEAYYGGHDETVAPAAAVVGAQLQQYADRRRGGARGAGEPRLGELGPLSYDAVDATVTPPAGPVVAYFILGECFRESGSLEEARRFLSLAADAVPENDTDRLVLPLVLSTVIGVLGASDSDRGEIRKRLKQFFAAPREGDTESVFARLMFGPDGEPAGSMADSGLRLKGLVTCLEQELADSQTSSDFWMAEILAGRARLEQVNDHDRGHIVGLWRGAMDKAVASQNARILLQAGQALGFEYVEYSESVRHLARYQFECLRGAEARGGVFEIVGANLFACWARLTYRHLSEKDLETYQVLADSAKEMKRLETPQGTAQAVMVLLLARLHRHEGSATQWAGERLEGHRGSVPDDVHARLDPGSIA
jgi:hypothetical protein